MSLRTRKQATGGFARDAEAVSGIIRRLLQGAHLTAVYVTGDLRLEFSRSDGGAGDVPAVTCLTVRSDWWIGERDQWDALLETPVAFEASPGAKREAMKTYVMVCLYRSGAEVEAVVVRGDGTLVISTSMGALSVSGREEVFEESWILEVPEGVPNHDQWSVVCTSKGELLGRPAT